VSTTVGANNEIQVQKAREENAQGKRAHAIQRLRATFPQLNSEQVASILSEGTAVGEPTQSDKRIAEAQEQAMIFDDYTSAILDIFKKIPTYRKAITTTEISGEELTNICTVVVQLIGGLILRNKNPTDIFNAFFTSILELGFSNVTGEALRVNAEPGISTNYRWLDTMKPLIDPATHADLISRMQKVGESSNLTEDLIKSL